MVITYLLTPVPSTSESLRPQQGNLQLPRSLLLLDQRNSTESCENTSIPKPANASRIGLGAGVPGSQARPLLPHMSSTSTEDESGLSARSAPTPDPGAYEHKSGTIKEKSKLMAPSVNLISPPAESESSTAVLESDEGVPAPPEFSGAAAAAAAAGMKKMKFSLKQHFQKRYR